MIAASEAGNVIDYCKMSMTSLRNGGNGEFRRAWNSRPTKKRTAVADSIKTYEKRVTNE
jgi:hypothetical protein